MSTKSGPVLVGKHCIATSLSQRGLVGNQEDIAESFRQHIQQVQKWEIKRTACSSVNPWTIVQKRSTMTEVLCEEYTYVFA